MLQKRLEEMLSLLTDLIMILPLVINRNRNLMTRATMAEIQEIMMTVSHHQTIIIIMMTILIAPNLHQIATKRTLMTTQIAHSHRLIKVAAAASLIVELMERIHHRIRMNIATHLAVMIEMIKAVMVHLMIQILVMMVEMMKIRRVQKLGILTTDNNIPSAL